MSNDNEEYEQSININQPNNNLINDNLELIYKFLFDPKSEYTEINKLWSLTNLNTKDVEELKAYAKKIRILDKKEFYVEVTVKEPTKYAEKKINEITGETTINPIYQEKKHYVSRFHNLIIRYKGHIDSICASAGGKGGSLIKGFRTATMLREDKIEDKTATTSSFWKKRK